MIHSSVFFIFFAFSLGIGWRITGKISISDPLDRLIASAGLGLGACSLFVLFLGLAGFLQPRLLLFLLASGAILNLPPFLSSISILIRLLFRRHSPFTRICLCVFTGTLLLLFLHCFRPQLETDAYMYHISAPLAWIRDGAIRPIPFNMHSQFHFLVQMQNLLLLALPGSGVACCKMTQLYYAVLLSLLAWIMGRRYYGSNVGSVLLCTTLLGWDAATVIKGCLMDLGTAFFTLSGIYFLVRSMEGERWKRHLVSGIFFGLAFSSKNTGILFFLVAGIAFALMPFIDIRERKKGRFVFLLFSGLVMILVALPWIVKNIAFTGNPFYPFLCRLFPTRWDYAVMAEGFSRYYSGFSGYRSFIGIVRHLGDELGLCIINIPYRECLFMAVLTITGGLLLVLKRGRLKTVERFLVLLGFLVLPMMILTPFSRFVAAFYPLAVLLFLGGMMRVFGKGRVFLIILILFVSGMAWRFGRVHVWTVEKGWNLKLVTGDWNDKRGKWGFLYEYYCLPNRDMVDYIDENLDDGDRVLICENHWMLSECPVPFIPNPHMHAPNLVRILLDEKGEEYTVDQLEKWGVTHLVIKGGPDSIPSRYFRERYCSDDLILYEKKDAFFSKVAKKGKKGV